MPAIRRLAHSEINKTHWDECVSASPQCILYGLSWYLDVASPNWEALVQQEDDSYLAVFPIPVRHKYGFSFIHQPLFCQFPFSKQMHEKLTEEQRKKIVFLYISIDDTQEAWKKAMEQLQLPGEHGWSEGGWNSKVTQYFGIQAIPRYILINKEGKVVNPNAKRPSDEFILSELLRLAEK